MHHRVIHRGLCDILTIPVPLELLWVRLFVRRNSSLQKRVAEIGQAADLFLGHGARSAEVPRKRVFAMPSGPIDMKKGSSRT